MGIFRKIGTKMIVFLLTTFMVVLGTFLAVVVTQTTKLADNMAVELVHNATENHANSIQVAFNQVDSLLIGMKIAAEQIEIIPLSSRRIFLDDLLTGVMLDETNNLVGAWACFEPDRLDKKDEEFQNTETTDETGRYATYVYDTGNGIGKTVLEGYSIPGEGDYYQIPYQTGKPNVTDPYDYEVDGKTIRLISMAYPIYSQLNTVIGVIGVNYSLEGLNALNNQVKLYESGFGKLITDKTEVVAHIDPLKVQTMDADLNDPVLGSEIRKYLDIDETYVGKIYSPTLKSNSYKAYTPISLGKSGKEWAFGIVVSEDEIMKEKNQMVSLIIIIGAVGLVAAALIIIFLANSISNPIKSMSAIADKIAEGDLTVTVPEKYRNQKDEIGVLAVDIQKMRDELLETVSGIINGMEVINNQMDIIHEAIGHLNHNITDTSASTEELSAGMEETGASAEELSATALEIEQEVDQIAEKAEEGAGRSHEIHNRASELDRNINSSIHSSNVLFKEIQGNLEVALKDSKAAEEINALADAILEITSQTTLLALNASIEAARAGEAGRGFAVVANEIGSLAEHSKNTVSQIQSVTKTVMSAVTSLSKSSNELLRFVSDDVLKKFEEMLDAVRLYTSDADYISNMTDELNDTGHKLRESTQVLLKAINEVSMAAQDGARTTTLIAEETNDIAGNVSVVSNNMDSSAKIFENLVKMVSSFKIK